MKAKYLFVVSDFYQAGAQRVMYEVDCELKNRNIPIEILCLGKLGKSDIFTDYFFEEHKKLGTNIVFMSDIVKKNTLYQKVGNKLRSKTKSQKKIIEYLNSFNRIFFMGEYVYRSLTNLAPQINLSENVIFIMSSRFQGETYRDIPKQKKYIFIGGFISKEEIEYEFEGFQNFENIHLPLSLKVAKEDVSWKFTKRDNPKIGIFTRLHKAKPLDPFFYSFHLLLKKIPTAELHIFGSGDRKEAEYDRYINNLNLNEKVFFRGHQKDIKETLIKENLNLTWFFGYSGRPAGYSGLDTSLTKTPMLLWDFYNGKPSNLNDPNITFPIFKDLELFTQESVNIILNKEKAIELSEKQYLDVFSNRNISNNVERIKHLFNAKR